MNAFSPAYADNYDSLYREKDYAAECAFLEKAFPRFVARPVKTVLDFGCGTGGHALPLAKKGLSVTGVDLSSPMIEIARRKSAEAGLDDRVRFEVGDLRTFAAGPTFDAVVCLFAVLSYQTETRAFFESIQNMKRHLAPGGVLICDFWYGPSVLAHPPTERCKVIETGARRLLRLTAPRLDSAANSVRIDYRLIELEGRELKSEATEVHHLRYFFKPEIEFLFEQAGLVLRDFHPSFLPDRPVNTDDWTMMAVAQAKA